ncbi:MAG: hypothetical protein ACYCT1_08105 [Steroidobacteraceae bacterium]
MRPVAGLWAVVAGGPFLEVVSPGGDSVAMHWTLPRVIRELAPGEPVRLGDVTRGRLVMLMLRGRGQGAGVVRRTRLPPIESDALAEIAQVGIGPDPEAPPGRRAHYAHVALVPRSTSGAVWLAKPARWNTLWQEGVLLPSDPVAPGRISIKLAPGHLWEIEVRAERRSAPYVVFLGMDVYEKREIQALAAYLEIMGAAAAKVERGAGAW